MHNNAHECVRMRQKVGRSGRRGSTTTQSYHGGEKGKYKITCDKNGDGTAYLWAAMTNSTSLTADDLDGAKELKEEEEEDEDDQDDELLDTVIVSAGKTVDQIKAMPALEKKKHARDLCNKNRSISVQSVIELATKMGCPSEYTTNQKAYECIHMHTNAYEYIRMQTNTY